MRSPLTFASLIALALTSAGAAAQPAAPVPAPAAQSETGRPFIRNYRPAEVGGDGQNWAIVQDRRGVIYVGGTVGVLEFDGAEWRLIPTPLYQTVRSLAIDDAGRIFVGAYGDFGYLEADKTGAMRYVSLLSHVPQNARQFDDVWRTFASADGVLFQTDRRIFRWANGEMRMWTPASRFNRSSFVNGQLYLTLPESGLNVLDGDTFRALPGTASLAREVFPVVLRWDDRRLLIGTRTNGLFLYDGAALTPFPTEIDDIIKGSLYRGVTLRDGSIALATTTSGFAIIDRLGRRIVVVDKNHGLASNAVYYMMPDREGALWATMETGIAHVETPSPASFFGAADGYRSVFYMMANGGHLYVAGGSGVDYLVPAASDRASHLAPVRGINNQCWWFETMPAEPAMPAPPMVVACSDGLYEIRGTSSVAINAPADGTYMAAVVARSHADHSRMWVGLFDGISSYRRVNGKWIDEGRIPGVTDQVRTLSEDTDGSLWAGSASDGVLHLTFPKTDPGSPRPPPKVERFGTKDGFASGGVAVVTVGNDLYFLPAGASNELVIATRDRRTGAFVRDRELEALGWDRLRSGFGLLPGPDGRVYANFGLGLVVLTRNGKGGWNIDRSTFSRFGRQPMPFAMDDPHGALWFGWQEDLVRYDRTQPPLAVAPPTALIRRVSADQDRVLFAGAGVFDAPRLPSSVGSLRFAFASPTFSDETGAEYQTRLEGLDRGWSPWSREARRDYTNVGFGSYRFRVRSRNTAGLSGDEAAYSFTILPPWYRTWWAYGGYVLILGLLVTSADRFQRRRLLARERQRAQFAEARLRAEAAETLARTEREGKRNIEALGEIGREITSSLDFETIFERLYERVNTLADADVFGVGLYDAERHEIEYRLAIENGIRYAPYTRDTSDPDQFPVWCINHREPVFINDVSTEYAKYISRYDEDRRLLADGTLSKPPQSIIYLPLVSKDRVLGVVTIQSFEKQAYTEHHLNVMKGLAAYTSIALDNAAAYRQLNEQEHENRRLFEEAQQARAAAEEADAAKSAFLSTVSHELRTPLTSVLGFAKIIKKRLDERIFPLIQTDDRRVVQTMQQVEDNLKVVVSEGERLTKLIDDVLDLAKIEAGKLEWHMAPVTIPDIVDHATAATASLFEAKGLRLVRDIPPDLPGITGDRDRLIQVVINLISNAVKFTPAGAVTCRAAKRGGDIVVSVSDTGVGISAADQPKVFERFKQVGDTLTDKPKGTGLGLPICREIVEHHKGRIWVESEPGAGSTFSFALPLTDQPVAAAPSSGPVELAALIRQLREHVEVSTPRMSERKPRILVVDDEANIRELLTQEFSEAGYDVCVAKDGRDAVASVRRERPDVIVLDVMMPEMNGFDVAAVLKNDPETLDIPIVILSIVQDHERGFRLGVDRYLTKPIDTDLLFREVGTLIEQKKSRKHVMVVDEDSSTVRTLSDVLKARGYNVSEARGDEMVEKAKALQPDIIMLNSIASARPDAVQMLRFEKGLENVLFLVYQ